MNLKLWVVAFFILIMGVAMPGMASVVTFSYTDGSTVTVTGQLQGTIAGDVFTATSASGMYNGLPISLVNPGIDPSFLYNNLVYLSGTPQFVDYEGLLFNVTGLGDVNLCGGTGCAGFPGYTSISNFGGMTNTNVSASFALQASSPLATPEPATLALCGSALTALAGYRRKAIAALVRR